jgi:AcrR family transcriptional regulator
VAGRERADTVEGPIGESPWRPLAERRQLTDLKRDFVLRSAARMFLERGYDRSTMNDLAKSLNITKPALYNYFRGKEEILIDCFRLGHELAQEHIDRIKASGGSGLDKIRAFIVAYAAIMTEDFGACIARLDDRELPPEARAEVRAKKRGIDQEFRGFLAEGVADGSVRDCDVQLTTFAILGALNWIGHWYRAEGRSGPAAIGTEFARRLTEGIATG